MKTNKIKLSLFGIVFLFATIANSQVIQPCSTDEMEAKLLIKDPSIANIRQQLEVEIRNFIANKDHYTKETYIIPVVFHIVHNNGQENIPKKLVEKSVEQMNLDFSGMNDDLDQTIDAFSGIIGTANIEFRLARLDPDGNCTEGITRTQSEATYGAGDNVKTIAPQWDRSKYLNIWVVKTIGSGAAAYAYYPSSANNNPGIDGIVCNYNYVGTTGSGRHTLTHETGHYLNLAHTWGSTNDPDRPENCNMDDQVEDTPNTIGSKVGSCNLSQNTCGSLDNVQNIMDYSGCDVMLTAGQVDRMHATLNSNISLRNNLWSDANLIATGTNDGYTADPCPPIADFMNSINQGCENQEVTFTEYAYNSVPVNRLWSFPGGIPESSTDSIVTVLYENPGEYNVSLQVDNQYGSQNLEKTNLIRVINTQAGFNNPVWEDFEDTNWPLNSTDDTKNWTRKNEGSGNWTYTNEASASGTGSIRIKNYLNGEAYANQVISPNFNLREIENEYLSFKYAYAKRDASNQDELRVAVSPDCGITWRLVYVKSGSALSTNIVSAPFIPEPDDWKYQAINVSNNNPEHLLVKFEMRSFSGNYLYIDDVKVEESVSTNTINEDSFKATVFPNPVNNSSVLKVENLKADMNLKIYSVMGTLINNIFKTYKQKNIEIPINILVNDYKKGIYYLQIISGKSIITKKILID